VVAHQFRENVEVVVEVGQALPGLGHEYQVLRTRVGQPDRIARIEILGEPIECTQHSCDQIRLRLGRPRRDTRQLCHKLTAIVLRRPDADEAGWCVKDEVGR
jgi:hypothetical protein